MLRKRQFKFALLSVASLIAISASSQAETDIYGDDSEGGPLDSAVVDYEAGVLAILQNDGRYGADGTEFTAEDTTQSDNLAVAQRVSIELMSGAHTIVLLYAPLEVTTRFVNEDDLRFRNEFFDVGTALEHRYLFDGYRASYLYRFLNTSFSLQGGGSLQVRNANVAFTALDGTGYAEESDIGLVPALKLRARYDAPSGVYAMFDADGLSTFGLVGDTQGGIYDVGLSLGFPLFDGVDLFTRLRFLGGGADVPDQEIENWAHFASASAGLRIDLTQL